MYRFCTDRSPQFLSEKRTLAHVGVHFRIKIAATKGATLSAVQCHMTSPQQFFGGRVLAGRAGDSDAGLDLLLLNPDLDWLIEGLKDSLRQSRAGFGLRRLDTDCKFVIARSSQQPLVRDRTPEPRRHLRQRRVSTGIPIEIIDSRVAVQLDQE